MQRPYLHAFPPFVEYSPLYITIRWRVA
uniref:Uncharacterized protein n=1 Tax=Arundo donax TaxID=35708 RepID=A0A0A9CJG1_ARUDO